MPDRVATLENIVVVHVPPVVREGLQGGTRIGLLLSVYLHKNIFIAMFLLIGFC